MSTLRTTDLHAHTTASDGDMSPTLLVQHAYKCGLTALAVTDHDTTNGIREAQDAAVKVGLEIVPGIELSAEVDKGQCHLLGFLIDPTDKTLLTRLQDVVQMRNDRNDKIVKRMQEHLGFDISLEDVEKQAGGDIVARPHFAKVMLEKGYVRSIREAFDVYLGRGGKAYVDRYRLSPEEAIGLIHGAGGLAVLAHPKNLGLDTYRTEMEIDKLVSLGLDGIEARYNRHTPEETEKFLKLAEKLGILTSGGSDFHGLSVKPDVFLGHVEGQVPAPNIVLDTLKLAASQINRT